MGFSLAHVSCMLTNNEVPSRESIKVTQVCRYSLSHPLSLSSVLTTVALNLIMQINTARSIDYFDEGESLDVELYDDATTLAAPLRELALGAHTIGGTNLQQHPAREQRQEAPNVPLNVQVETLNAQLAAAQAVSHTVLEMSYHTDCAFVHTRLFALVSLKSRARSLAPRS